MGNVSLDMREDGYGVDDRQRAVKEVMIKKIKGKIGINQFSLNALMMTK